MNMLKQILFIFIFAVSISLPQSSFTQGWQILPSFTTNNLYSIGSTGAQSVFISSDSAIIYKYGGGGSNWSVSSQVQSVKHLSARYILTGNNNDWNAVGDSTLFLSRFGNTISGGRIITTPNAYKPTLRAFLIVSGISFYQASIATGDSGIVYRRVGTGAWQRDTLATRLAAGRNINKGRGDILVGDGGLILKADSVGYPGGDGIKWKLVQSPAASDLYGVFNSSIIYFAVGADGVILKSTNTGTSWMQLTSPTTEDLYGIWINYAYLICGKNGTILKSTDAQHNTWFRQTSPTTADLYAIYTEGYSEYIAMGENGVVIRTTDGGGPPMAVTNISSEVPDRFSLGQNYPNPFNPATKITFDLPSSGNVELNVYDMLGREAANIINSHLGAGRYEADFDASNLPSGIYFYRITAGEFTQTKKMILVK